MSDIKDKLKELLATRGVMAGSDLQKKIATLQEERAAGAYEIERVVPGKVIGEGDDHFYLVRTDYPLDTARGKVMLGDALRAHAEHIAFSACDSELVDFDATTAVFVDAETSGLAGGTGTVAFLMGFGYFTENVFRLEQCFMRDYDEEEPMLRYIDALLKRFDTVVSYNGKSFDVPLLRTRMIANRIPSRLDTLMQFDLLHAARRFWKVRLRDCSLGNIERAVLGVERHGDVSGAEIPELYFDYLRTRDARKLDRVFYHHACDILSLAALMAWLSQCLAHPEGEGFEHAEDRVSLVKLHFRQKRYDEAIAVGMRVLEEEPDPAVRRACLELMATAYKKNQDWQGMANAWELLLNDFPEDLPARLELAKYHEHRSRNLVEAARLCAETIQFLEVREALERIVDADRMYLIAFSKRLHRLRSKLSRAPGLSDSDEELSLDEEP
ncbi:MAG TPA: ribonuclease H-like domain-containing protein [Candidatus Hydrogenedentes bacterium]|nr:ribonuclease H-like domain-containing protein [Candidatus Hydrogenedentota bacterium]HOS01759.1 ribonuclease H-like domain-containing protein [Candidatus Hydrogenedentota bacterium]